MAYPISFIANDAGLGDAWFYARAQRPSDGLWYHYAGGSAGTFDVSVSPLTDANIRIPLDEIGNKEYGRTISDFETYYLHFYVHDDVAVGDPIRANWYVNIVAGSEAAPPSSPVDDDGPPYTTEAGRIFGSSTPRGVKARFVQGEFYGTVPPNLSSTFLARLVAAGGGPISIDSVSSIAYSIYLLNDRDPTAKTPVTGHVGVFVPPGSSLFSSLQVDYQWGDTDEIGYNFRFTPSSALGDPFPYAGRNYLVNFVFDTVDGEDFSARFKPTTLRP
jgi:hypothetical protein